LKANLKYYDARNESRYDRVGNKAVFKYHDIHVGQLHTIYKITGDRYFKLYRDRWAQYELDTLQKSSDKTNKSIEKLQNYQSELSKKKSDIKAMISEEESQDAGQTPPPRQSIFHEIISKLLNPF
jgi:predicted transcriptional regulator